MGSEATDRCFGVIEVCLFFSCLNFWAFSFQTPILRLAAELESNKRVNQRNSLFLNGLLHFPCPKGVLISNSSLGIFEDVNSFLSYLKENVCIVLNSLNHHTTFPLIFEIYFENLNTSF